MNKTALSQEKLLENCDTTLRFDKAAEQWIEALPVGNGRLGAMTFGGVATERLQLNEGTLWAGGPHCYDNPKALEALPEIRSLVFEGNWKEAHALTDEAFMGVPVLQSPYQTVGDLLLSFPAREICSDYRRELDLETAIALTSYEANGVRHHRNLFASAADQVIVLRLAADLPASVSFSMKFESEQRSRTETSPNSMLRLWGTGGDANGITGQVRFTALAKVVYEGGSIRTEGESLCIESADSVTILISIATSYLNYQDVSGDSEKKAADVLAVASMKSYEELLQRHLNDYQPLFKRVSLRLGSSDAASDEKAAKRPTDERIATFYRGDDPQLAALHFQFGRYLLISSSRAGGQPATLQGLWNDSLSPPWGSKFTININTEMNYWPAAPANLIECCEPLFDMISELAVSGERTARTMYGARGWVAHHNTDAWRGTAPVDGSFWGMWPTGGAWLCKSVQDHFDFTLDEEALSKRYGCLKGAALFFLDTLIEDPNSGYLVTCPSVSPENGHHKDASLCAGPTMDTQILRDLFATVLRYSERVGEDAEFREKLVETLSRLAPMKIGKSGQLQEWQDDWDSEAPEQDHRHVSHLYGLFPSAQITKKGTPELFEAARKSLELRGDMATGWSLGWKINLWARLQDGDRAFKLLTDLLSSERTAPNLFDMHPPFQIDGNFGAVSGVCEMLLQSHEGEIHLLPALPSLWKNGVAEGLVARGRIIVDLHWRNGKLTTADFRGKVGTVRVRLGEQTVEIELKGGETLTLNGNLE